MEAEIAHIVGEQAEAWGGTGGSEPGDRQSIVFVFELPDLLPRMKEKLTDLGYSYCEGDARMWRGFEVELPPEPSGEE